MEDMPIQNVLESMMMSMNGMTTEFSTSKVVVMQR